jgi:hypothetical protein
MLAAPKFLVYLAAANQFIMPPKRYHKILGIPPLVTTLFWRKTLLQILLILSYRLPPITHLWISPTQASEIIITYNPINPQHVKTNTNIINSTITRGSVIG